MFNVTLKGFKTEKQAAEFLSWYSNSGEQAFYDHLDIVGLDPNDGCNIDCHKKGNYVNCFSKEGNTLIAFVE